MMFKFCIIGVSAIILAFGLYSIVTFNGIVDKSTKTFAASVKDNSIFPQSNLYYDELLAKEGRNYRVCSRLSKINKQLDLEARTRIVYDSRTFAKVNSYVASSSGEKIAHNEYRYSNSSDGSNLNDKYYIDVSLTEYYDVLLKHDKMSCGRKRSSNGFFWGIFSKQVYKPWMDCVPQILPAKKRLTEYLTELCNHQKLGSEFEMVKRNSANASSSINNRSEILTSSLSYSSHERKRGVIYTGKAKHFRGIFQSIYTLRNVLELKSIQIEVWTNHRDMSTCKLIIEDYFNSNPIDIIKSGCEHGNCNMVRCMQLRYDISGFVNKFFALLHSSLTDVLYLDADNVPARDINLIFDSSEYAETGMVLWPDLWGDRCRFVQPKMMLGDSAFETFVLYSALFPGFAGKWSNDRLFAQEAEAGQIAIDLTRHRGLLRLGQRLIEDELFFKQIFNGDKDIFRIVHILVDKPMHYVSVIPGFSTSMTASLLQKLNENKLSDSESKQLRANLRDCMTHYFDGTTINSDLANTKTIDNASISQLASKKRIRSLSLSNSDRYHIPNNATHNKDNSFDSNYPFFFHQFKLHQSNSFSSFWRLPNDIRDLSSVCVDINRHDRGLRQGVSSDYSNKRRLPSVILETDLPIEAKSKLVNFGKEVIQGGDLAWSNSQFKYRLFYRVCVDKIQDGYAKLADSFAYTFAAIAFCLICCLYAIIQIINEKLK